MLKKIIKKTENKNFLHHYFNRHYRKLTVLLSNLWTITTVPFSTTAFFNSHKRKQDVLFEKKTIDISKRIIGKEETNEVNKLGFKDFESLTKNFFSSMTNIKKKNENVPENILNVFEEISYLIHCAKTIRKGEIDSDSSFFDSHSSGLENEIVSVLIKEIQDSDSLSLKKFGEIELFFHEEDNDRQEEEKNTCDKCKSHFFTKEKKKATTIDDIENHFSKENYYRLFQPKMTETSIFLVNSVECSEPERTSHATVLVISRKKNSSELAAYYCNSHGLDMPKVLKDFLIEKIQIKNENIKFSTAEQQWEEDDVFCHLYAINNSKIISDLMLFPDETFPKKIDEALDYEAKTEYLLAKRKQFLEEFGKKFLNMWLKKIEIFDCFSSILLSSGNAKCSNKKEWKNLFPSLKKTRREWLDIKNVIEWILREEKVKKEILEKSFGILFNFEIAKKNNYPKKKGEKQCPFWLSNNYSLFWNDKEKNSCLNDIRNLILIYQNSEKSSKKVISPTKEKKKRKLERTVPSRF